MDRIWFVCWRNEKVPSSSCAALSRHEIQTRHSSLQMLDVFSQMLSFGLQSCRETRPGTMRKTWRRKNFSIIHQEILHRSDPRQVRDEASLFPEQEENHRSVELEGATETFFHLLNRAGCWSFVFLCSQNRQNSFFQPESFQQRVGFWTGWSLGALRFNVNVTCAFRTGFYSWSAVACCCWGSMVLKNKVLWSGRTNVVPVSAARFIPETSLFCSGSGSGSD